MIGAGLAGITAGALLPAKVPGIQLTILEKNPEVVCQFSRPSCCLERNQKLLVAWSGNWTFPMQIVVDLSDIY